MTLPVILQSLPPSLLRRAGCPRHLGRHSRARWAWRGRWGQWRTSQPACRPQQRRVSAWFSAPENLSPRTVSKLYLSGTYRTRSPGPGHPL